MTNDTFYTETHEWVRLEDARARVGITDYAQSHLGDVVFLELPEVGRALRRGEVFGSIESVKAASDLYAPIDGVVAEVNRAAVENPELVNRDPLGDGWMVVLDSPGETATGLLDGVAYQALTATGTDAV
ncbi:MAG: glycine cleavage system protein GcvH [Candidatus Dormibacteria bacterium]